MDPDRDRFEAIFRQHYGAVVRYAVRRVGREGSDEVVSETFLVAWRHLDRVPDNALPWLFATARKVTANELRRRERQARLAHKTASHAVVSTDDLSGFVDESLRIRAALEALSARDQEVLQLSAWDGLSTDEAARVLGCSCTAYKVRLHRARRRLAAYLGAPDQPADRFIPEGDRS